MKRLVLISFSLVFVMAAYGQDDKQLSKKELRRLQKEQRKAEQADELERMGKLTEYMVSSRHFVLEADFLSDRQGSRVPVEPTLNFIIVDSLNGTIQLGSAQTVGYNGVGGATVDGRISSYEYSAIGKNKNSYSVIMNFMSSIGTYYITLMVNADGKTDASVRGNWSGVLNYHGQLVPLDESRIYKGYSTF
jgi:hypothetical protein